MTLKEAIYAELLTLCAGALPVSSSNVKLDMRTTLPQRTDSEYPYILFRRVMESEATDISYSRQRFEFEVVGLRSSKTKGDALLEQIKDIIKDHFSGLKMIGGIRMWGLYIDTMEGFDDTLEEKAYLIQFAFHSVRG
jgi:hypothetical protein